ncbi:MAG: hypothetical protein EOP04_27555 [Proteobacteria bacterium]|nr:MAG: hypothetical protein EOP04_27555 [Pseudomonadota bacterium]
MDSPQKIYSLIKSRKFVGLVRGRGDFEEKLNCYILALSNSFLLVQTAEEFTLSGFSIIPIDTVLKIESNQTGRFYNHIMKAEGLLNQVGCDIPLCLDSWMALFKSLKAVKVPVIVECEHLDPSVFSIGTLRSIGKDYVSVKYFNSAGFVEERPDQLKFQDITRVTFGDRYSQMFAKHVSPATS